MGFSKRSLHFCVLIPCFNDEEGLIQALQSIHYNRQHYIAVVVDDGSKEAVTEASIQNVLGADFPLQLIRLEQNSGITQALNTGLEWILAHTTASYIARLDCRDICHPERFAQQVTFLNAHADVGLLGSWCTFKEEGTGISYLYKTPLEHEAIKNSMYQRNVFIHPAVMFRASVLQQTGLYPFDYPHAEDYALFWKMLQVTRGAILPRSLVTCAVLRKGISYNNQKAQLQSRGRIIENLGDKKFLRIAGLVKLNLFMIVPKALILRLKGILNKN